MFLQWIGENFRVGDWVAIVSALAAIASFRIATKASKAAERSALAAERTLPIAQMSAEAAKESAHAATESIPITRQSAEAALESASHARVSADVAMSQHHNSMAPTWETLITEVANRKFTVQVTMKSGPYSIDAEPYYVARITGRANHDGELETITMVGQVTNQKGLNKGDQFRFFIFPQEEIKLIEEIELTMGMRSADSEAERNAEVTLWRHAETIRWIKGPAPRVRFMK